MKALLLQQGHTVFCKTSRDASHNDGIQGSAIPGCPALQKHYHTRNIDLRPTVRPSFQSFVPFHLIYVLIGIRAPRSGSIFYFRPDEGFVG